MHIIHDIMPKNGWINITHDTMAYFTWNTSCYDECCRRRPAAPAAVLDPLCTGERLWQVLPGLRRTHSLRCPSSCALLWQRWACWTPAHVYTQGLLGPTPCRHCPVKNHFERDSNWQRTISWDYQGQLHHGFVTVSLHMGFFVRAWSQSESL